MSHSHTPPKDTSSHNLKVAFFINLGFAFVELIGGVFVNSIAILSDAVHDFGDSLSLGIAWYLHDKSKKKSNEKYSYGYARFSLLGALINSLILVMGSFYIIHEAIDRFIQPQHSNAEGMFFLATLGITVNGYVAWKMSGERTLNEKVISWHHIEDVLGWLAVLIVSVVLIFYDFHYLDPALSLLITFYILWNVIKRLKETLFLFLQGIPPKIDIMEIEKKLLRIEKVQSIHHTHIWSLEGKHHVFTTHARLKNIYSFKEIMEVKMQLAQALKIYDFKHLTIETELDQETCSLSVTD